MYKCNDCEVIFEEPNSYQEYMGEFWGSRSYQTFYICPCCGSDDYEEYVEGDEEDE